MMMNQKVSIQKELLDRATGKGKEPTWDGEPTKLQLVTALNFYSTTVEPDQLQKYAVAWAKKFSPDSVDLIAAQSNWKFQTVGALMRIATRGLKLSKEHMETIKSFVLGLEMPEQSSIPPTKSKGKRMTSTVDENATYHAFCDALDKATAATKYSEPKFKPVEGSPVAPVVENCERELAAIKEDPSVYPAHMGKWFRAVIRNMGGNTPPPANDAVVAIRKAKAAPVLTAGEAAEPAPKKAPAKVATPKVPKPKAAPAEAAVDPNCPLTGKSVAYLFDTRYGRLTQLVASSKTGFQIKGKTIHGIDEKKSKVALLKNVGNELKVCKNITDLEGWMGKCVKKGNPIPVSTRTASEVLVLAAA